MLIFWYTSDTILTLYFSTCNISCLYKNYWFHIHNSEHMVLCFNIDVTQKTLHWPNLSWYDTIIVSHNDRCKWCNADLYNKFFGSRSVLCVRRHQVRVWIIKTSRSDWRSHRRKDGCSEYYTIYCILCHRFYLFVLLIVNRLCMICQSL